MKANKVMMQHQKASEDLRLLKVALFTDFKKTLKAFFVAVATVMIVQLRREQGSIGDPLLYANHY